MMVGGRRLAGLGNKELLLRHVCGVSVLWGAGGTGSHVLPQRRLRDRDLQIL